MLGPSKAPTGQNPTAVLSVSRWRCQRTITSPNPALLALYYFCHWHMLISTPFSTTPSHLSQPIRTDNYPQKPTQEMWHSSVNPNEPYRSGRANTQTTTWPGPPPPGLVVHDLDTRCSMMIKKATISARWQRRRRRRRGGWGGSFGATGHAAGAQPAGAAAAPRAHHQPRESTFITSFGGGLSLYPSGGTRGSLHSILARLLIALPARAAHTEPVCINKPPPPRGVRPWKRYQK